MFYIKSFEKKLRCLIFVIRFSYSSGQSPSYTNYRMGWSTGYINCQPTHPRYNGEAVRAELL